MNSNVSLAAGLLIFLLVPPVSGADEESARPAAEKSTAAASEAAPEVTYPAIPEGARPLNKSGTVLLDAKGKRVLLLGRVSLREGLLEMLLCKAHTKEHESILSVDADAFVIHAGLLATGAEPGAPVRFMPEFRPPTGQEIDIWLNWTDEKGRLHRDRAQTWVRSITRRYYEQPLAALPAGVTLPEDSELRYDEKSKSLVWFGILTETERDRLLRLSSDPAFQKAIRAFHEASQVRVLEASFVFAGSGFYTQKDGKKWYQAEAGNVICVANFSDAMIDISVPSTADNAGLMFEPFTERVPAVDTPVTVELVPVFPKAHPEATDDATNEPAAKAPKKAVEQPASPSKPAVE